MGEVGREVLGKLLIVAFDELLEEALHVVGLERRAESYHLVYDTAEAPNVTLIVIWIVLPHLWRSIVRRTCLCVKQSLLGNFRNV